MTARSPSAESKARRPRCAALPVAAKREAAAPRQAPAQQDHRRGRPGAGGRLRFHEFLLARHVRANNNRPRPSKGASVVKVFRAAFDDYWANEKNDSADAFGQTVFRQWHDLGLSPASTPGSVSPPPSRRSGAGGNRGGHQPKHHPQLFYSLAFLYEDVNRPHPRCVHQAPKGTTASSPTVFPTARWAGLMCRSPMARSGLSGPRPSRKTCRSRSKSEPSGGGGARLHHKFVVSEGTLRPHQTPLRFSTKFADPETRPSSTTAIRCYAPEHGRVASSRPD